MTIEEKIAHLEAQLKALKKEVDSRGPNRNARYYPELGDEYYYIDYDGQIEDTINEGAKSDKLAIGFFNTFDPASHDNLEKYAHDVLRVQNRLMQLHEELCPECWIDFGKCSTERAFVYFDAAKRAWNYDTYISTNCCGVPFAADAAQKACEILNEEKFMIDD